MLTLKLTLFTISFSVFSFYKHKTFFGFFRDELLKALLPIRSVFPSLLRCLFQQPSPPSSEEDNTTLSEPATASTTEATEQTPKIDESQGLELTYCPLCRQPSYQVVGQDPETIMQTESSDNIEI